MGFMIDSYEMSCAVKDIASVKNSLANSISYGAANDIYLIAMLCALSLKTGATDASMS